MADEHLSDVHIKTEIAQFKYDVGLVHKFSQGSETEDVVTENGLYPTLAKLIASFRSEVASVTKTSGGFIRKYSFANSMVVAIDHTDLNANVLDLAITDLTGQRIYARYQTTNNVTYIYFTEEETGNVTVMFSIQ